MFKWFTDLPPLAQRFITGTGGALIGAVGILVPPMAPFTTPLATGIIGWSIAHTADYANDRNAAASQSASLKQP